MRELKLDFVSHRVAAYACTHWHYLPNLPVPPIVKIGVWESERFIGVVIFSHGSANIGSPFGLDMTEAAEMSRVALREHAAPVTRIVKVSVALLRRTSPGLRVLVSFADPAQDHHGGIYQGGNWIYLGQMPPTRGYIGPKGELIHNRMVSATGLTRVYGVTRAVFRPDQLRSRELPGKHKYVYPLDRAMRAQLTPLAQPYPKRVHA